MWLFRTFRPLLIGHCRPYHNSMLRELAVQNLALIEDVRVELAAGFCVWSGETGAGKSLLLGALGLLLGERGSPELIRTGAEELRIRGRFDLERAEQRAAAETVLQDSLPEGELVITRRWSRTGKSTALVNEQPVAVATLRRLGEILVDVHGQRESYSLLQPQYQLELLDSFGKLQAPRAAYAEAADLLRKLRAEYRALAEQTATRQRDLALIRFERDELAAAKLQPKELLPLQQEREKLLHASALASFTATVANRLYDDEGAVAEVLGKLSKEAQPWASLGPALADLARRLETLRPEVRDLADTARDLSETFEANPARLDQIEHRIALLKKLESKYHKPLDELVAYFQNLSEREAILTKQEGARATIEADLETAFANLKARAEVLTKLRGKIAKKLVTEAKKHLHDLQMPLAKLDAVLEPIDVGSDPRTGDVPQMGFDHLEILLAANPGEPPRP
ncbi:MAG: AAA family ATPase, partial [Gemmataceae bacterium]